jgi:hypothetical protein
MVVSIHQPNFIPWYPFFQKIQSSDIFVILTHCQFEKNNFQNRFNFEDKWYTLSVNKGLEPIKDKKYVNYNEDWAKIKTNLSQYNHILSLFDEYITENLAYTNVAIIRKIAEILDIKTRIIVDKPTDLKGTDRLVNICKEYKATKYLAGSGGSKLYLEVDKFTKEGIDVEFQQAEHLIKLPILKVLNNEQGITKH